MEERLEEEEEEEEDESELLLVDTETSVVKSSSTQCVEVDDDRDDEANKGRGKEETCALAFVVRHSLGGRLSNLKMLLLLFRLCFGFRGFAGRGMRKLSRSQVGRKVSLLVRLS